MFLSFFRSLSLHLSSAISLRPPDNQTLRLSDSLLCPSLSLSPWPAEATDILLWPAPKRLCFSLGLTWPADVFILYKYMNGSRSSCYRPNTCQHCGQVAWQRWERAAAVRLLGLEVWYRAPLPQTDGARRRATPAVLSARPRRTYTQTAGGVLNLGCSGRKKCRLKASRILRILSRQVGFMQTRRKWTIDLKEVPLISHAYSTATRTLDK